MSKFYIKDNNHRGLTMNLLDSNNFFSRFEPRYVICDDDKSENLLSLPPTDRKSALICADKLNYGWIIELYDAGKINNSIIKQKDIEWIKNEYKKE